MCTLAYTLALGVGSAAAAAEFGEEGTHAGQFRGPYGVAVNQETGDVFVADQNNWRVERFQGSGSFSLAWGWQVNEETPAEELQTCTASCESGRPGTGAGTFASEGPRGVTVDNNALSSSHGDVYVTDWENYRVEKFGPQGEFMLMFGGGVITGGATGTGDLTSGSTTVSAVTTTSRAFLQGQTVTGTGIPPATTITHIGEAGSSSARTITLSRAATASGSGVALTVAAGSGAIPSNERQTVTIEGTPTGGTFTLKFTSPQPDSSEATSAPIAYNAPASGAGSVQESLEALANIGAGNVAVSGAAGGPYTVEFKGARYSDTNVKELEADAEGLLPLEEEGVSVATALEGHSTPEVCAIASICQAGVQGTADGQFRWAYEGSYIAVGPGGKVYVGDQARVQVFEPSGAWKENISLAGLSSEGQVGALAVDQETGDVFVKDTEASGVREFAPNGTEMLTQFDEGSFAIAAVALDAAGNVYVADTESSFQVLKYDPAGEHLASFGAGAVGFPRAMAFADATGQLYVTDAHENANDVKVLAVPPSGPVISGESGTPALHGEATLQAMLNPQGHETTYHFEYITEKQYAEDGDTFAAGTVSTSPASLIAGFSEEPVQAKLLEGALVPGQTYRWRLVASSECEPGETCTTDGATQTLEETPGALIDGPWVSDVTSTSAMLSARIDPQGASTSYRLQYGASTAYGHEFTGNVGAGTGFVSVGGYHLQELTPGATYHVRVITVSECITGQTCTVEGPDHAFTTQIGDGSEFALLDGRAWELVSPASTGGSVFGLSSGGMQAASEGRAIVYKVSGQPLGENAASNQFFAGAQILSLGGPAGWRSEDINTPQSPHGEEDIPENLLLGAGRYPLFSTDLTSALSIPPVYTSLSPEGLKGTDYLRNNLDRSFAPLFTAANTPQGTDLEPRVLPYFERTRQVGVLAGTPDLSHVLLAAQLKLTPDAIAGEPLNHGGIGNIYEWSAGQLQLVSVLPGDPGEPTLNALLAGLSGQSARAVSNNGRRVAFTLGQPYGGNAGYKGLYLRDMVEKKTVQLGGVFSRYQTMTSDGSRVFFLEKHDLYEYDLSTGAKIDLTATHGPGEANAGVQESVSDVSEDGSYVYFVAAGVLAAGGVNGEDNLYMLHDVAGQWSTSYVATLAGEDEHSWHSNFGVGTPELARVTSRVSPNGRYLTFMSQRSLTGYDNTDVSNRETEETIGGKQHVKTTRHQDEEVYLYDALTGRLVCTSCNPTGARPHGVFDDASAKLIVEHNGQPAWGALGDPHWLGGSLPAWEVGGGEDTVYQPRYLSDGGRLFFDSPDALVPYDINGLEDVYEYEPTGIGGCTSASATFSARSDGCVGLVSSGQTAHESAFMDASENGDDVFFLASGHLTAAHVDTGYAVWNAHVCSASSPCLTSSASPSACSSGDSCKPAPRAQPELFGPSPSATFSGAGNSTPTPPAASKPSTRAQKLAKALSSCRKKYRKAKKRRATCERAARRSYGHAAKRSRKTNTIKRGAK